MIDRRHFLSVTAAAGMLPVLRTSARGIGMIISDRYKPTIFVNQIGYLPSWPKIAVLQKIPTSQSVKVIDLSSNRVVDHIVPNPIMQKSATDDELRSVDFSRIKKAGRYQLAAGNLRSASFEIGTDVFQGLFRSLLRAYYLQRCGVALEDRETGLAHAACHSQDGLLARSDALSAKGTEIANAGGWHDAGDFGKYVATTAVTIGELLSLYEQQPNLFFDGQLGLPESGNGRPDILDEMSFGLKWMLAMQRADGAVYRKASGLSWPKPGSPDADTQQRYVFGISTPETAKFCAAMAIAARVYRKWDEAEAMTYLQASLSAWAFLEGHVEFIFDCEPSDNSGSGSYMSNQVDKEATLLGDEDDRAWAGAELFLTTRDPQYLQPVNRFASLGEYGLFEWKNPAPLGFQNLLNSGGVPTELKKLLRQLLMERATQLLADVRVSPWGLSNKRMIWGSNKIAASNGSCLLTAARHFSRDEFAAAAVRQLDYILGVNPLGQCFVTGAGAQTVAHVAHLYARGVQMDIPGLLVGGPNDDAQDKVAPGGLGLLSYLDDERSYSTNEFAIDYNAALIGLIGGILARGNSMKRAA